MADPRTRLSDYRVYRRELDALENAHLAGDIPPKEFLAEADALLKRHPKVHPEDIHYFEDHKAFSLFIYGEMGVTMASRGLVKHEFQHYVEARGRGLECRFGCALLINDSEGAGPDARTMDPFVVLGESDSKDAKAVVSAAKDKSKRDKELENLL